MATTTKKNTKSTPKVNYNFDSKKETASQYNARVASERGDSSKELKSMQSATQSAFKEKGLDVNKLTSTSLTPNAPYVGATPPVVKDTGNIAAAGNAGVATGMEGMTLDENGLFQKLDAGTLTPLDTLKYIQANTPEPVNQEKAFYKSKEYQATQDAQKQVNDYTAQLNQITAQSNAQQLALEGQGRGQTESFVGGEQARINREAAIAALPIQAQLAAAQGNLEFAQKQLDTVFTLRMEDARNKYKYETDKLNSIVGFLDNAETRQYNERIKQEDRKYQTSQDNINYLRQLSAQARENGNTSVIGQLGAIDPASPTFEQDVARVAQGIRKPSTKKSYELKNIGTADKPQWVNYDSSTGATTPITGIENVIDANGLEGAQEYSIKKADIQMGLTTAQNLLKNKNGLKLATGAFQSPLLSTVGEALGTTAAFGAAGSVVPGIGTATGLITGAGAGLITSPFSYSAKKVAQDEFLAGASFLISDTTFQEIRDLKASGVTFGNMTEGERIAAGRAASNLASAAEIDASGKVTGFRGSEATIAGYVRDIEKAYQGRQEYLDMQYSINKDEITSAKNLWEQYNQTNYAN